MSVSTNPIEPSGVIAAGAGTPDSYHALCRDALALVQGESDWLANLANLASLVFERIDGLNWAGFYLMRGDELVLGPFQGRPACVRIAVGKGVCGTAVATRTSQRVVDVHAFPGHIACDPRSRSELVVPIVVDGAVVAVLDLDSDRLGRFDEADQAGIEALVEAFTPHVAWSRACRA